MADQRDPIAAMNNNAEKEAGTTDATGRNYTEAFDVPDQQGVMGPENGPQHRAPPRQGLRAPFAAESGELPQTSVFDGKGNESVVVYTTDKNGRPAQGSGPDIASAQAEAEDGKEHPGSALRF